MKIEVILQDTISELKSEVARLKADENHYYPLGLGYNQSNRLLRTSTVLMAIGDTLDTLKSLMEESDELPPNARGG